MKNNLYITLFAAAAFGFASCGNDLDMYMVDDTVGLLNSGLVEAAVYTGNEDPTSIYVMKAGKGFSSASASIAVDQTVLADYNSLSSTITKIAELPEDCYTISVADVKFSAEDYRLPFEIKWNRDRLEEVLAENPNQGVPLRMTVQTDAAVDESRLTTIIKPVLDVPYVSLERYNLVTGVMPTRDDAEEIELYFKVTSNFIAQRDITFDIEIDPTLVEDYNTANGTAYKVLPEESYTIDTTGEIKQHLNSNYFHMTLKRSVLVPDGAPTLFGDYILPVRLSSISSSQLNPEKSVMLYAISIAATKVDKAKWSVIDCNSSLLDDPDATDAEKANNGPDALIDGTTTKFWRSIYRTPQDLPYYATIDFGRMSAESRVGFEIPASSNKRYANSKAGYVELSEDGVNWTKVGDWTAPSVATQSVEFDVTPTTARYMKFVITEAFKKMTGSGIKNGNSTAIGEISVWGEIATWLDNGSEGEE